MFCVAALVLGTLDLAPFAAKVSATGPAEKLIYLALGDSFSSGEGNVPFRSGPFDFEPCHRSFRSYPEILASTSLKSFRLTNRTC
jgi:hypothetical protein